MLYIYDISRLKVKICIHVGKCRALLQEQSDRKNA